MTIFTRKTEDAGTHSEVESFTEIKCNVLDDGLGPRWMFWKRRRYIVLIMLFLGEIAKSLLRSNLSIALFPMTENSTFTNENGTVVHVPEFNWDVRTRGFLLSVFYYGYLSTTIPGGILAVKYGGARLYGLGIILASITTIFAPFAARIHLYFFIAVRVFEGMSEGVLNPSIELLLARWIPKEERISCASVAATGNIWGHMVSIAVSSAIGFYLGWEAIFYITGGAGVVWYITWFVIVKEHPKLDTDISVSELSYIQKSCERNLVLRSKFSSIPYVKIITSLPACGINLALIAIMASHIMTITHLPAYVKDVLQLDFQKSGYLSSVPVAVGVLASYIISPISDILTSKKVLSVTAARKAYICGSMTILAIFGFVIQQATSITSVVACLALMQICTTLCVVQFAANIIDIAGRFTSVMTAFSTVISSLIGISIPTLIGYLTQNKTAEEWHTVFTIQSVVCLLGALTYGVSGSGDLQHWANERRPVIPRDE